MRKKLPVRRVSCLVLVGSLYASAALADTPPAGSVAQPTTAPSSGVAEPPPVEAAPPPASAKPAPSGEMPAALVASEKVQQETPVRSVSLTFSPFSLLLPEVRIAAEVSVTPKFGVMGILGYGWPKLGGPLYSKGDFILDQRLNLLEVGVQAHYYAVGDFDHGMQLAAALRYLSVFGEVKLDASANPQVARANGSAIAPSALIGYKIAAKVGFTFNVQLGIGYAVATAKATDGRVQTSSTAQKAFLDSNMLFGWSF
jgi:hypothetical protein